MYIHVYIYIYTRFKTSSLHKNENETLFTHLVPKLLASPNISDLMPIYGCFLK